MKLYIAVILSMAGLWGQAGVKLPTSLPGSESELSVRDVGEYGGVPWQKPESPVDPGSREDRVKDLNLSVASVNLSDNQTKEFLSRWVNLARWGRQQDKKFLPRVFFWDGADRVGGPLRPVEIYWRRMDRFLSAMDLRDFYGIVLAEENVPYGGHAEILTALYHRIKAKWLDLKVYQWWSPSDTVPTYNVPADGWIVNNYDQPNPDFRRHVLRYRVTGAPVVIMPNACWIDRDPLFGTGSWTPERWKALEDQLEVCREYNLPIAFYWVMGDSTGTSAGCGFGRVGGVYMAKINERILAWIKEVRAYPADYSGRGSADASYGDVLELGPNEKGQFAYGDDFQTSGFILDADIEGFRDLVWEKSQTLALRSWRSRLPKAALTYKFEGDFAAKSPRVDLAIPFLDKGSTVGVKVSRDNRTWDHSVLAHGSMTQILTLSTVGDKRYAAVRSFFVRIEMSGFSRAVTAAARIDDVKITADLSNPTAPVVFLKPQAGRFVFEDDFKTRKYLFTTRITDQPKLEWRRGQIAVRPRPGGTGCVLVWDVRSPRPVKHIRASCAGMANRGSLGTNHYLDVSTDGVHWGHEVNTVVMPTDGSGWARHGLTIHLAGVPNYTGVTRFYVRLRMRAGGHDTVHIYNSGMVNKVRIEAEESTIK